MIVASREELLVALTGAYASDSAYDPKIKPSAADCAGLVREAQAIADAACKSWGHGALVPSQGKTRGICTRCGKSVRS